MYSAQLLDHFQNPRNAGELADADAVAEIQNPACGDIIRLTLKMHADRIEEIRFKAKGEEGFAARDVVFENRGQTRPSRSSGMARRR